MRTLIVIKTQFSAVHDWPDCNIPAVEFLKNAHRHLFYVVMKFKVSTNERELEFLTVKAEVDRWIYTNYKDMYLFGKSCETLAQELMEEFGASFVSVFEDNENGAEIYED